MSSSGESGNRSRDEGPEQRPAPELTGTGAEPSDASTEFGSFVSSSVRQSFRQLKREAELARATSAEPTTKANQSHRTRRPAPGATEGGAEVVPVRAGPVGRRWRDAVSADDVAPGPAATPAGAPPRRLTLANADSPGDEAGDSDSGADSERFDVGAWFRDTFLDEDGPNRRLWLAIAGVILAIVIVILLLQMGGDGDNGSNSTITPEPTTSNVINADRTPTTGSAATAPSQDAPQRTPTATQTPEVQRGGDNQR